MNSHIVLSMPLLAIAVFTADPARAGAAGGGGCTEVTYGMPCDPGNGQGCGGICQPDFTQADAPMRCLPADAAALARLKLSTLDGVDCSPTGAPGTDCGHACVGGACVAKNAAQGAACLPSGDVDAGIPGIPVSVCSGTCDGNGVCTILAQGCEKYGRGELSACLYTACSPLANVPGCAQYPTPQGSSCSTGDVCVSGAACDARGLCGGGTRIPDCTEPDQDAAVLTPRHADDDASTSDASDSAAPAPAPTSSGGCSIARGSTGGALLAGLPLAVALLARRRRRARD